METFHAATVLIIREKKHEQKKIVIKELGLREDALSQFTPDMLSEVLEDPEDVLSTWTIEDNYEILFGQNEVINWLKSANDNSLQVMRYPGEFKLPGGRQDKGESLHETAVRELAEEFMLKPKNIVFQELTTVQTKPVNGRSYIMHNFVAFEHENPWIKSLDEKSIRGLNSVLSKKRQRFYEEKQVENFWKNWKNLSLTEKEKRSPEVVKIEWLGLARAIKFCLTTKCKDIYYLNSFQENEFKTYAIEKRDPMYATLIVLLKLCSPQSSATSTATNGKPNL
eukprot:snap_masked-scaffold_1-processed-gene-18.24-mRNA-1 protein AED:0.12 eAED:0.14 QI:0/-1/0/1/-1/1/1/0/280